MRFLKSMLLAGVTLLSATSVTAQDTPRVVAVNHALQHFADRLLGGSADVVLPVPQDVDPSFWRPSIADISAIQSSDLILLNGAGFATWVARVSLPRSKIVNTSAGFEDSFIVTESITHSHGDGGEHAHEGLASYTWLDPTLAMAQADAIAAAITARGLAPEDEVAARLDDVRSDLTALDSDARTALAPLQGVGIIATHPRYQYLARHYDLSIASLEWDAGATPTDAQLADLQALVDDTDARILIWEAEPSAEAFEATSALGLRNVVFPSLAHADGDRGFVEAYAAGVSDLSDAGIN